MKRFLVVCFVAGLLLSAGCGDDDGIWGPPPGTTTDYYPIALGSSWQYDASGTKILTTSDTLDISGTMSREVIADTMTVDSIAVLETRSEWFLVYVSRASGDTAEISRGSDTIWVNDADTLVTYYWALAEGSRPDTLLVLPPEVGTTWQSRSEGPRTAIVSSVSESVDVPAGGYDDCALVEESSASAPRSSWKYYYASGTGEVQQIEHAEALDWSQDLTYGLTVYTP